MAKPKPFSATAENQSQQVALPMRGNQRLVLLLFPTFRVLRNPSREFWIATTLKLLKNLFRLWGIFLHIFCWGLRTLSWKNNEPTNLFRAMTVITSVSDRPIISLVYVWKSIKKWCSFAKKKRNSALSEHTCLTNHTIGRISLKLPPVNGVTTSAFVWKPGVSTPPTLP